VAERSRDWIWGAVALVILVILVLILAPPGRQVAQDRRLTTLRTTPDGAGALYETLEELGIAVDRRMTPLAGVDRIRGPLVLLEPTEVLSPAEIDSLFSWVEAGGHLIVAPAMDERFEEALGLAMDFVEADSVLEVHRHPWTTDVAPLTEGGAWAFLPDTLSGPDLVPLVSDPASGAPVVGLLRRGDGTILALADGELLANETILEAGIAPIVVRAAAEWAAAGDTVWFDEYHHGHRGGSPYRALGRFMVGDGIGRVAVQLLLVALLALVPAVIRFGAPMPERPPSRRSRLEHVAALGSVYQAARAEGVARRRLLAGFARRIGRERPPPGAEETFLHRLEKNVATGAEAVAAVRDAWSREASVPELAHRIDEAVTRLNPYR
jgi:hypothetical protein